MTSDELQTKDQFWKPLEENKKIVIVNPKRITKQVTEMETTMKKRTGRPGKNWIDQVGDLGEERGKNIVQQKTHQWIEINGRNG